MVKANCIWGDGRWARLSTVLRCNSVLWRKIASRQPSVSSGTLLGTGRFVLQTCRPQPHIKMPCPSSGQPSGPVRWRRYKTSLACTACRRRKLKCDGARPGALPPCCLREDNKEWHSLMEGYFSCSDIFNGDELSSILAT